MYYYVAVGTLFPAFGGELVRELMQVGSIVIKENVVCHMDD